MSTAQPLQISTFPTRPGLGRNGQRATVRSNFFPIQGFPETVYQYDVEIEPTAPMRIHQQVFRMVKESSRLFNDARSKFAVYDGKKIAYSPTPLPMREHQQEIIDVELPEDDNGGRNGGSSAREGGRRGSGNGREGRKFRMQIQFAATVDLRPLTKFITGRLNKNDIIPMDAIMALDVVLRQHPTTLSNCVGIGQGFYTRSLFVRDPREIAIGNGVEAWNGMKLSARCGVGKMFMLADVGTSAFVKGGNLIDLTADLLKRGDKHQLRYSTLSEKDCTVPEKSFRNFRIKTTHQRDYQRKRRIAGVTATSAEKTYFEWENEGRKVKVSVAKYFADWYRLSLEYPNLPCVVTGASKQTYLPLEVCEMLPNQHVTRKLDEAQTANMIRIAQKKPNDRLNRIMDGVTQMVGPAHHHQRSNDFLRAFGVQISDQPTEVDARILPAPSINYNKTSRENTVTPRDGTWNLRDKLLSNPSPPLQFWSVLVIHPRGETLRLQVENFILKLVKTCVNQGMRIKNGKPIINISNGHDIEEDLKRAVVAAGGDNGERGDAQLVAVVLPDSAQWRYAEVKRVSDTILGVPTQCVQEAKVKEMKKSMVQYCANVCLKMNVKLGGTNSYLGKIRDRPQLPFITEKPTMIIGADVTHPGPQQTRDHLKPSIAAMVGSLSSDCTLYASTTRLQRSPPGAPRQDLIHDITAMTKELLIAFQQGPESCGNLPHRILVYRDGVPDGQFSAVRDWEVRGIKRACVEVFGNETYRPAITFVVVQKRHHARFFTRSEREADRSGNVRPGTVVDNSVVHPTQFDFYLTSHAGLQGTSRPAHYRVLHDKNAFTSDTLQDLTYKLCYLYARCTRSVSVVPPVYYADLVASRERFHFKDMDWSESESSKSPEQVAAELERSYAR
ncbi:eukaryotic translation initiation factor 2C, 2 [Rhizophlyctis rosea]|nr:eukaryotic translation initiation factor 2C, 2 [Rhizophlyctis rosea]